MPDEVKPTEAEQVKTADTQAPSGIEAQPDGAETPKTYTPEQVEEMIKQRVAREKKAAKEAAELAAARAKMDEAERLKAERADLEKKAADAEARAVAAERKAALAGKVADHNAALKLVDDEKHLDADGNVDVAALLKDYPFLKPTTNTKEPVGAANPPGGGSSNGKPATMLDAIERDAKARRG